jgi:hypothetical protein
MKRCAAVELHSGSASITATGSCRRKGAFCRINVREQRNVRQSLDVAERWLLFEFKAQGVGMSRTCHKLWAEVRA